MNDPAQDRPRDEADPARELLVARDGHVLVLTLNRPQRRNALSRSLLAALSEALLDANEDDEVRAIVLTGAGSAFCSGADLRDMRAQDNAGRRFRAPTARVERTVFEILLDCRVPVIGALNGSAMAGGFELALACDMRVSHRDARFGLPEATLGMGAALASVLLPRMVAPAVALEMLCTGAAIDAAHAQALGLLNHLAEPEDVLPRSLALAQTIAANAPLSVRRMKATALRARELPVAAALRLELGPSPYTSEDRQEGVRARLEKRAPVWRGR